MNIRFSGATTRRSIAALALTAAGLLSGNVPALAAWEHAHGDSANTGFARLNTAPAARPSRSAPVGRVAPGANPVVAPNGTVYVGNLSGELKAFHANGAPYWTRELNSLHGGIFAAPVVGADGSVYVVSSIHYRDHRDGVLNVRNDFFLHKFTPGGGWVFAMPFPEHFSFDPAKANRGATTAPPNIWRANGTEAIIAPVVVEAYGGEQLRLVAFSTNGDVLDDELVRHTPYEITGGSEWASA